MVWKRIKNNAKREEMEKEKKRRAELERSVLSNTPPALLPSFPVLI